MFKSEDVMIFFETDNIFAVGTFFLLAEGVEANQIIKMNLLSNVINIFDLSSVRKTKFKIV